MSKIKTLKTLAVLALMACSEPAPAPSIEATPQALTAEQELFCQRLERRGEATPWWCGRKEGLLAPPFADACPDRLAGRWHARRYADGEWLEHRVRLTRQPDGVTCEQEFRSWPGGPGEVAPPPCPDGGRTFFQARLRCEATERPSGDLYVRSVELLDRQAYCGGEVPRYNFDHFEGALDGNQWDAVNDDGVDDVGQPYRFRRVSCEP